MILFSERSSFKVSQDSRHHYFCLGNQSEGNETFYSVSKLSKRHPEHNCKARSRGIFTAAQMHFVRSFLSLGADSVIQRLICEIYLVPPPLLLVVTLSDQTGRPSCPIDPYYIMPDKCKCVDYQILKLQETPEDVPNSEMPRHMQLYCDR